MVIAMDHDAFLISKMDDALALAEEAMAEGEVPVAAIITDAKGQVIAATANRVERDGDATAHAEMLAIREACAKRGQSRLTDCDLWVTLEPCPMCAGAIAHARFRRLYYGADDPKSGGVSHGPRVFSHATCHHKPDIYSGLKADVAAALLTRFFKSKR